jgi:hypothetical protein
MILCLMYTCPPYPTHQRTKGRQNFGETDAHKLNVRFGSKADMCSAKRHVRFTPNNDIDCVFRHVRFGPIADIGMSVPRQIHDVRSHHGTINVGDRLEGRMDGVGSVIVNDCAARDALGRSAPASN